MPFKSIKVVYLLSPVFTLFFPMFIWLLQPFWFSGLEYKFAWILIFCGCSFNVYFGFLSGWVSNSKYSIIGSFRAVSQMISYEVALAFIVIFYRLYICRYNLNRFDEKSILLLFYPFGIMWFIICLRESQRTPFDLAEGESELVSGFNTEYSASNFALLFLGEYMSILFMCMLRTVLVFGYTLKRVQFVMLLTIFFTLFIWARCTFPRIRYDCLMLYLWKGVLPALILIFLILFLYNFVI